MSGTAIIALEGVLRSDTGAPIQEGVLLYRALATTHRLVLVLDTVELSHADYWLRQQFLKSHQRLLEADDAYSGVELRRWQIECLRAGGAANLLVDSSPANVAAALSLGVAGLLFAQPRYLRPEFRPDTSNAVTPWADIEAELDRQRALISSDQRVQVGDVVPQD